MNRNNIKNPAFEQESLIMLSLPFDSRILLCMLA